MDGAQAADGVDQEQLVELTLDDPRDGLEIVGYAGGSFIVSGEDGLDVGVLGE